MMAAVLSLSSCAEELQSDFQKEGTPYTIIANSVDTKTVNNGLKTAWAENDAINVFHAPAGATTYNANSKFTVTDVEGGVFETTALQGTPAAKNDWYALYPYAEKITSPANTHDTNAWLALGCKSGSSQTQTGNNSMAHIAGENYPMYGMAKNVDGTSIPEIGMKHLTSLVKVNVTNSTETPLTVTSVSITAEDNINGTYLIDFTGETPVYTASGENYVAKTAHLNVKSGTAVAAGQSAAFYIAIKPFTAAAGQKLTLSVNGSKKEKALAADVTFAPGKIKTLNFKYDEAVEPMEPLSGEYVIVAKGGDKYYALSSEKEGTSSRLDYPVLEDFSNDMLTYMTDNEVIIWNIQLIDSFGKYSIKSLSSSKYLSYPGSGNAASTSDELYKLEITQSDGEGGTYKIKSVDHSGRILCKNSSNYGFAFYTSGQIQDLYIVPVAEDTREKLTTPQNVSAAVVDGTPNAIKVSWDAVENATGYSVTCDEETKDVTDLTCTFESLSYNTEYSISVIAVGDSKTYKPSEAGTTTVTTGASETPAEIYALVTDATELATGDKVIIVSSGSNTALGAQSGSYRAKVDIEISDKTISLDSSEGVEILTLAAGSGAGTFAFMTSGNVYLSLNGDANALNTSDAISEKSSWNIAVSSGSTTIQNVNYTARYINYNSSSPRFACYKTSSKQQPVEIYKLTNSTSGGEGGSTAPVFDSVGSSNIGETTALVYCAGTNLTLATELKFYLTGGGTTLSAAASTHYETYASAEFSNLKAATTYTYYVEAKTAGGSVVKSEEGTFTTEKQSTQLPATYGWLELPSKGNVSTASEYVARSGERNYTAYYDTDTYSSLWIAYPLAEGHSGSLSRPEGWYFAPNLDQSVQVDLTGHSYNDGYSRGHQIPNGDRNGDAAMQKQTFYVINSVPQIQNGFNGGIWNALENAVRAEVPSNDSLYIATGPVYKTVGGSESLKYTTAKDDNKNLPVPNYFFKVVLKVKRSGSQITDAKAVGFWFDHKVYSNNSYEACAVSVDEIERKTGYDFFVNLPDSIEAAAETNSNWSTFCSF